MTTPPLSRRKAVILIGLLPLGLAVPVALPAGQGAGGAAAAQEPQPHMRAAPTALQSAKRHLEQATADKGGHRLKAIGHVNAAIDEVQLGIR
jgi:hypothetical protein